MTHKLTLRPPIAFSKGMQCVDLAEVIRSPRAENIGAKARKPFLDCEFLKNLDARIGKMPMMREHVPILADVHSSQAPSPLVKITE